MKKVKRKGKYYCLTQEEFIERCKQQQKVELDYSKLVYETQHDSATVRCIKHDREITARAQNLLVSSFICPDCLKEHRSSLLIDNLDKFLVKFNTRFPDNTFDFSNSVYVKSNTPMTVVCDKGHSFEIKPNNLMTGYGCAKCHHERMGYIYRKGREGYLPIFKEVHGDTYSYDNVHDFVNCKEKVVVTCYTHGDFTITPDNHVSGRGCPLCGKSGYKSQEAGTFYILRVTEDVIKFGITNNIERRLKELNKKSFFLLEVMCTFDFNDGYIPRNIENEIIKESSIIKNVVNKADLPCGYTETTYTSNIPKLLSIVDKHKPA